MSSGPTLGPLTDRLKALLAVDDFANPHGSSYFGGWYGYVVQDLAASTPTFCGGGDPVISFESHRPR